MLTDFSVLESGTEYKYDADKEGMATSSSDEEDELVPPKKRTRWIQTDIDILKKEFKAHLQSGKIPRNNDVYIFLKKYSKFNFRTVDQIKSKVQHLIKTHKN